MDTPREWLEVSGPTVDVAVAAALQELGLERPDQVSVEVIQEAKRGVLGLGGREAIVKVSPLPSSKRRRRRRRRRSGTGGGEGSGTEESASSSSSGGGRQSGGRQGGGNQRNRNQGGGQQRNGNQRSGQGGGRSQQKRNDGSKSRGGSEATAAAGAKGSGGNGRRSNQSDRRGPKANENATKEDTMPTADISEQADVAKEFLEGLLGAFGLEGTVTTRIEEDILYLDVAGEQTEALVGARGTIMTSVMEITRTVVQRKTFGAPRMRLDIAGYAERRRAALTIYAGKLADQVKEEGSEVMLEPMNPADRKVVHDAVSEIDGVRSFSEGEDPHRAVVIAID